MVCAGDLRLSYIYPLDHSAFPRTRSLTRRALGFLDCRFCILPTWLVEQPNPDWRLLSWLLTLEIVSLSLCAIYFVDGKSWLKHFGFSVCFILWAVPWPKTVEDFIIQGLTQLITVTSLNLFHIWALQHGNLIEVKTGLPGVDEACSGIRSSANGSAAKFALQALIVVLHANREHRRDAYATLGSATCHPHESYRTLRDSSLGWRCPIRSSFRERL